MKTLPEGVGVDGQIELRPLGRCLGVPDIKQDREESGVRALFRWGVAEGAGSAAGLRK